MGVEEEMKSKTLSRPTILKSKTEQELQIRGRFSPRVIKRAYWLDKLKDIIPTAKLAVCLRNINFNTNIGPHLVHED